MGRHQEQRTRDMYLRVQYAYQAAIEDGKSPIDYVCRRLDVSENVAKQRIWRARRAGYVMTPPILDNRTTAV